MKQQGGSKGDSLGKKAEKILSQKPQDVKSGMGAPLQATKC
jgi:hypothetical protein